MDGFRALPPDYKRERDPAHLDRVRKFPCVVPGCWAFGEPHHLVSRGAGGSDLSVIPLCREHHHEIHRLGVKSFEEWYGCDVWYEVALILADVIRSSRREEGGA